MPSRSRSQQRLFQAAAHGASFPKAREIQASMSLAQMQDFSRGPMTGKPEHVKAKPSNRHRNLGKFLHPRKGAK